MSNEIDDDDIRHLCRKGSVRSLIAFRGDNTQQHRKIVNIYENH